MPGRGANKYKSKNFQRRDLGVAFNPEDKSIEVSTKFELDADDIPELPEPEECGDCEALCNGNCNCDCHI